MSEPEGTAQTPEPEIVRLARELPARQRELDEAKAAAVRARSGVAGVRAQLAEARKLTEKADDPEVARSAVGRLLELPEKAAEASAKANAAEQSRP